MSQIVNTPGTPTKRSQDLCELALMFLRLGATAFGGPAVHIALLEHEVVNRRKWLTHEEFLDLLGVTNLIPGPNSTEMAIHIGSRRAGWRGLIVAGCCFIVPAFLITLSFAWFYVTFSSVPQLQGLLYGVKPVVLAVVAAAIWRLGRASLRGHVSIAIALAALIACLLGVHELLVLLMAGVAAPLLRGAGSPFRAPSGLLPFTLLAWLPPGGGAAPAAAASPAAVGLISLFSAFVKIGSVLYGSGYVLVAFLQADFVDRWGWLTQAQLLDAVAVGQFTPGPLFTTATFIGYLLEGGWGAVVATIGIFLPAFVAVAAAAPLIPWLRRSVVLAAGLDGVNAASLALMAAALIHLFGGAIVDLSTVALGAGSTAMLLLFRVNPIWLILAAGAIGVSIR
ncbi:MAG: chromate efflux transporter [Phycisphaerales bacterium]|nr:chromate efflux transporter [Phycisphaerales bacterium]